ncbi:MAG: hypothetical protein QM730_25630 [Anaerolineales bacterium]
MSSLSMAIGEGIQTFRIRNFDQYFSVVEDLGPDQMSSLSKAIGEGIQTFRIRNFDQHFSVVEDLGPDRANWMRSRKIVKLNGEDIYYVLVEVFYKDFEEFVVRITTDLETINWKEIADNTEKYRWRGPVLDSRYIN